MSEKKSGSVITPEGRSTKAKSFLQAIAEIEQISAAEIEIDLPPGAFPTPSKFSFSDVAVKHAAVTTFATFFMAPFSILVMEKFLPIFGNRNPGTLDIIFAYLLSAAPAVSFTLVFVYIISNIYIRGAVTKSLLNYYVNSYIITKFTVTIFLLMVFAIIYKSVITPENIGSISRYMYSVAQVVARTKAPSIGEWCYNSLVYFRNVIIQAAVYSAVIHVGCAILLGLAYFRSYVISRRIDILRREWE